MIDLGLIIGYILFVIAVIGAIGFPLRWMIKHPKESKMTFLGIVGLIVIFFIGWVLSGSEITEKYNLLNVNASESKLIGGALIASYIVGVLALVFAVGSQIRAILVNK